MIQIFKMICHPSTGAYDEDVPPLFELFPRLVRGHNKKLKYEGHNLDIRKYSFTIRNIKLWNSLTEDIVNSNTIIEFEKKLDKHWYNQKVYFEDYRADIQI